MLRIINDALRSSHQLLEEVFRFLWASSLGYLGRLCFAMHVLRWCYVILLIYIFYSLLLFGLKKFSSCSKEKYSRVLTSRNIKLGNQCIYFTRPLSLGLHVKGATLNIHIIYHFCISLFIAYVNKHSLSHTFCLKFMKICTRGVSVMPFRVYYVY